MGHCEPASVILMRILRPRLKRDGESIQGERNGTIGKLLKEETVDHMAQCFPILRLHCPPSGYLEMWGDRELSKCLGGVAGI